MKFNKLFKGRLPLYLGFWAVSFYICLEIFSRTGDFRIIDVIYTILFHVPMVYAVSVHSSHLMINFLAKGKYWIYALMLFFLLASTFFLYKFTFNTLSEWIFPDFYLVGAFSGPEFLGFVLIYLVLSSSLEFSRTWFGEIKARSRVIELESEKTATELKALKAQVNPHFLFNSLNAIYGESLKGSDKTPKMILLLSDMLRYVLDKMESDRVALQEEISYLKNYVEMQKQRLNYPEKVQFNIIGNTGEYQIAPLLLINFLENCFKHADLQRESGFIQINVRIKDESLELNTSNMIRNTQHEMEQGTGLGIENARKRLELAYPEAHQLSINDDGELFEMHLKLDLKA